MLLPKETETNKSSVDGSGDDTTLAAATTQVSGTVVSSSDNLTESVDQQQQQQQISATVISDDTPKLEQYILDSITSSSSTSITSSLGFQSDCVISASNSQTTQNDTQEMPQLLNILNELLDGQDLSQLANSGANMQDNMPDDMDQEENFEDDSPRKDEEELARMITQQRREEICKEELQLRRRMDFLIRRLYKFVARSTVLHASEEIAGFLEHVARYSKKKEKSLIASKFPYLSANLQGISTELLTSPAFTSEPPTNLLSSPSTSTNMSQEPQINSLTTTDVIEPSLLNDSLKPVPYSEMKSFLRRINNISTMQSTVLTKRELAFKFFSSKSSCSPSNLNQTSNLESSAIPKLEDTDVDQVEQTSGLLLSELRMIENQVDSDATASSTGGESADEMILYNNHNQRPLSISKRASYKYAKDRGAVASRWCWLTTQISELDYKIRHFADLRKHIRDSKGNVTLEATGFEGQLPGNVYNNSADSDGENGENGMMCARVRPFAPSTFRKRKLIQIANLHQVSKKAAKPSTIKCGCNWPLQPCALCTARIDPTAPRESMDVLPETERVALLDPGFHPVLSFPDDVPTSIHLEAIMNIPEWQTKMIRSSPKSIMKHATKNLEMLNGNNGSFKDEHKLYGLAKPSYIDGDKKMRKGNIDALTGKRKYTKRFMKLDPALANKLKDRKKYKKRGPGLGLLQNSHIPRKYTFKKRIRKFDSAPNSLHSNNLNGLNGTDKHFDAVLRSKTSSPVPNSKSEKSSNESRRARNYDINNIVIPYSVAASTRVELLSYKEIPTPKWRVITDDTLEEEQNVKENEHTDLEDLSDEHFATIHEKALLEERKKFETYLKFPLTSRSRANRRIDSRGNESSGANTPDPTSPAPALQDLESTPSPLDGSVLNDTPSIAALLNNFNGRKERKRTISKKDERSVSFQLDTYDGSGNVSGAASRCITPESFEKVIVPAYEPLNFPLSEVSFHRMKRIMPNEQSHSPVEKFYSEPPLRETSSGTSQYSQEVIKRSRPTTNNKKRKHNDSISESILIKEKLPSTSFTTIGKINNVLIPRNNHNILNSIDLKGTDSAALKKLMNNNNGDLTNGDSFDDDNILDDDNSDSETVTGDESFCEPEDTETDDEDYLEEINTKMYNSKKKNNSAIVTILH